MSAQENNPAADLRIESHVWKVAGVVILGMIMSILDTTIVNVALPTLSKGPARPDLAGSSGSSPVTCWPSRR